MRTRARAALALLLAAAPAAAARDDDAWFRSGREAALKARVRAGSEAPMRAKSVVLFVGDGMGPSTVAAARILAGQKRGESGEENALSFETLPTVGFVKTYNTNQQVPDSAGTMTAMMSGVKTKAGVIGLDDRSVVGDPTSVDASRVPTLLEEAEDRGLATGIITNTRITHATPAACYGHASDRDWEDDSGMSAAALKAGFSDLALQLVSFAHGDGIDVVLGGGRAQFLPANAADLEDTDETGARWDERDLVAEWQTRYPDGEYVWNRAQFEALDPEATRRVFGLFDRSHMEYEVDRANDAGGEPSLSEMTEKAIRLLSQHPAGFVLVVEGGRIDHAHHAGNAFRALTETIELADAVERALALVDRSETLVVVTADHSQPLVFSGYATRGNPILGKLIENDGVGMPDAKPARDGQGRPFTTLSYPAGPGHVAATERQPEGPKRMPHVPLRFERAPTLRPDLSEVDTGEPNYLQEALVPRFAGAHAGEDVAVYAGGPGAALFGGVIEQHVIYHAMALALGWDEPPAEPAPARAATTGEEPQPAP